ncbi:CLUMA_CG011370, isoform A [Clunio marinus]|uniref:CLUMA_CG011370, isoform A n=1 Tax=Clunio marinus TaxID=568069 RepID=A0A1J1IHR9_9DIPT|nr:CLUMA_CG011370, isoform A [Clunio marinus]
MKKSNAFRRSSEKKIYFCDAFKEKIIKYINEVKLSPSSPCLTSLKNKTKQTKKVEKKFRNNARETLDKIVPKRTRKKISK